MKTLFGRWFGREEAAQTSWIDHSALRQRLARGEPVSLVDVRQPEEFSAPPGHLPGALNIPLAKVAEKAGELRALGKPIVIVCKTDRRSAQAAVLVSAGLRDVTVLRGGTDGWHQQGLPLA